MTNSMPRAQRAFVIAACAIIGGAFAYAASEWGQWPRLRYFPLDGDVSIGRTGTPTSMLYWGIVLWGLGGAACGALAGALLVKAFPRIWTDRTLQLFGAWSITAILLAGGYFTWALWPW